MLNRYVIWTRRLWCGEVFIEGKIQNVGESARVGRPVNRFSSCDRKKALLPNEGVQWFTPWVGSSASPAGILGVKNSACSRFPAILHYYKKNKTTRRPC